MSIIIGIRTSPKRTNKLKCGISPKESLHISPIRKIKMLSSLRGERLIKSGGKNIKWDCLEVDKFKIKKHKKLFRCSKKEDNLDMDINKSNKKSQDKSKIEIK